MEYGDQDHIELARENATVYDEIQTWRPMYIVLHTVRCVQYQAVERRSEHTLIWLSSHIPGGRSSVCLAVRLLRLASTLWLPARNNTTRIRQC